VHRPLISLIILLLPKHLIHLHHTLSLPTAPTTLPWTEIGAVKLTVQASMMMWPSSPLANSSPVYRCAAAIAITEIEIFEVRYRSAAAPVIGPAWCGHNAREMAGKARQPVHCRDEGRFC
jgi:hypothetical protein